MNKENQSPFNMPLLIISMIVLIGIYNIYKVQQTIDMIQLNIGLIQTKTEEINGLRQQLITLQADYKMLSSQISIKADTENKWQLGVSGKILDAKSLTTSQGITSLGTASSLSGSLTLSKEAKNKTTLETKENRKK